MLRLFTIDSGLIIEIPVDEGANVRELVGKAKWIDAQEPTDTERDLLSSLLRIDLPESDDVEEIETSARYFIDNSGLHVHSLFISKSEGRHVTMTVACILQSERLITIRDSEVPDFRLMRLRARRRQVKCKDVETLLVTLIEQKVENHADTLEDLHKELEKVSHAVLEDDDSDLEESIEQLAKLEDSNGKVRLCLMDNQRALSFMLRHLQSRNEHRETLHEIGRDIDALMSHTTFLFDKINFLMGSTHGFINIEQNQIIKIFSIAAVVFLPPTVIASIYGMNFHHMPELDWKYGFAFAIALMIVSGVAPLVYFKKKGWL